MARQKILLRILVLAVAVLFMHLTAITFHLYWTIKWFDMPVHFLAGLMSCLIIVVLFDILFPGIFRNNTAIFFIAIVGAVAVGLMWEYFEYIAGVSFTSSNFFTDTVSDLSMDILGAVMGWFYFLKTFKCQKPK